MILGMNFWSLENGIRFVIIDRICLWVFYLVVCMYVFVSVCRYSFLVLFSFFLIESFILISFDFFVVFYNVFVFFGVMMLRIVVIVLLVFEIRLILVCCCNLLNFFFDIEINFILEIDRNLFKVLWWEFRLLLLVVLDLDNLLLFLVFGKNRFGFCGERVILCSFFCIIILFFVF